VIVACVVVTTAWLLIVIVELEVAMPIGTAVFPLSCTVTDTATALPAVVGVPVTWQVGGAIELIALPVRPTVENPVYVQEYVVWVAGNPPIVVTETVGYGAMAAGVFVS
jgi:hypothetical protein